MTPAQRNNHSPIPDPHSSGSPSARQEPGSEAHTTGVLGLTGRLDVDPLYTQAADAEFMPSSVRVILEEDAQVTGLEIDEDSSDEPLEPLGHGRSVYALSMYPGVPSSYRVERPYEYGHDLATMNSARTLYAADVNFDIENNRQYCGDYFLPCDTDEQTRQYAMHQVYLKLFDFELTTVPLNNPSYILDIGTGIGEWAIGMAERYPECDVFGTDIAPIQPTQVPSNAEFHIDDAEEDEWVHPPNAADLVHIRNMEGAFSDWTHVYRQSFRSIKPGGWIEVIDWEDFFADKNYLSFYPKDSAAYILTTAIVEASKRAGKPRDSRHLDPNLLVQVGFVDIQERVYNMGVGSRTNSRYGHMWLFALMTGMEATSLRLLTKYLLWDADYVRELCRQCAQELKTVAEDPKRIDPFVVKLRVVVGRKPLQWVASMNGDGDVSGDESTIGERTIISEDTI
ncbi:hypothetical protein N0V88_001715 [Collariella sp. IMI 366227]|nr:hypothetical protein N0V88_001715 [Collariella sp. IMI 366227]